MKVVVLGTRGIPDIQGGVETHCQELYPRLSALGCDITLITRKPYVARRAGGYRGVKLKHLYAPRVKSLEAISHSVLGVLTARGIRPDLLHIHAVGPSLVTPVARLLGMRVVVTNHGPDYDRQKWGALASSVLRLGERLGTRYADRVIVISKNIQNGLKQRYGRTDTVLIHNGVSPRTRTPCTDYLRRLGVEPGRYVLGVGRFVEEKRFHDLLEGFVAAAMAGMKLVIAGNADHETEYSKDLKGRAARAGAVLTGFITGTELDQVFSHAALFVLPSSYEGLPIALLEALAYNLPVLASDIPANLEVGLEPGSYFRLGDVDDLARKLTALAAPQRSPDYGNLISREYDWDAIAGQTLEVYRSVPRRDP